MAEHTPGPWRTKAEQYRWADNYARLVFGPDANDGTPVAAACDLNRTDRDAEVEANARLIAVAPEMYALLDRLHADLARYAKMTEEAWSSGSIAFGSMADDCSRLLAKARGESA